MIAAVVGFRLRYQNFDKSLAVNCNVVSNYIIPLNCNSRKQHFEQDYIDCASFFLVKNSYFIHLTNFVEIEREFDNAISILLFKTYVWRSRKPILYLEGVLSHYEQQMEIDSYFLALLYLLFCVYDSDYFENSGNCNLKNWLINSAVKINPIVIQSGLIYNVEVLLNCFKTS